MIIIMNYFKSVLLKDTYINPKMYERADLPLSLKNDQTYFNVTFSLCSFCNTLLNFFI